MTKKKAVSEVALAIAAWKEADRLTEVAWTNYILLGGDSCIKQQEIYGASLKRANVLWREVIAVRNKVKVGSLTK